MKIHHRRDPDAAGLLGETRAPAPAIALVLASACFPADAAAIAETRRCAAVIEDWPAVIAFAARHRICALVAHGFAAAGITPPPESAATLAAHAQDSLHGELRAFAESRRIETRLRGAGIEAMLIKGMATAMLAFGRAGLRHSRDIDLLVTVPEVDAAAAVLGTMGYVRAEPPADVPEPELAAWRETHKDMVFANPATGAIVELHWRLFDNPHLLPAINAVPPVKTRIGNLDMHTLPADANFLYLCMHGAQHAWSRLKWLADVNAILARGGPDETARLFAVARRQGGRRGVAQAVILCGYLFGLEVPDTIFTELRRDRRLRWLVRVALSAALGGGAIELEQRPFGSTWKNVAHYWLADGWRYRAAELRFDFRDGSAGFVPSGLRWTGPAARPLAWLARRSLGMLALRRQ